MDSINYISKLKEIIKKANVNRVENPPEGVPRYTINGVPYFSVTQILDNGRFVGVDSIRMFHARILGSVVHHFIENFFRGNPINHNQEVVLRPEELEFLNEIPPADDQTWQDYRKGIITESEELFLKNKIQTAFDQFFNFYEEQDVELVLTEEPIWSPTFKYAGTVDLICKLNGHLAIIDHKTSKFIKTVPNGFDAYTAQLSAYYFALKDLIQKELQSDCYILQLNPFANDYQIIKREYNFSMFLDALSRFSGGKPSNNYFIDNQEPKEALESEKVIDKLENQRESILEGSKGLIQGEEKQKTISFNCSETGCKEVTVYCLSKLDFSLFEQNIPVIVKSSFHEDSNHYHITHLKTDTWTVKEDFIWMDE